MGEGDLDCSGNCDAFSTPVKNKLEDLFVCDGEGDRRLGNDAESEAGCQTLFSDIKNNWQNGKKKKLKNKLGDWQTQDCHKGLEMEGFQIYFKEFLTCNGEGDLDCSGNCDAFSTPVKDKLEDLFVCDDEGDRRLAGHDIMV